MRKLIISAGVAALFIGTSFAARADETAAPTAPVSGKRASDGADPATKTLPAKASDKAKANAFGQQGARERALHATATAAAVDAATHADDAAARGADNAALHAKAHGQGPASQAAQGQATAAAARASHPTATSHPGR
jgi:hypothetical protein